MTVEVRDVTKTYRRDGKSGRLKVLDRISFDLPSGSIGVVLGPSGCGKSTLLRIIAGTEQSDSGSVRIAHNSVGIVFQQDNCFPWLNAWDNVSFGLATNELNEEDARSRVRSAITQVRLDDYRDHLAAQLSGGQKQRVAFARLLASRKKLWLLDEPFSALDSRTRKDMQTLVSNAVRGDSVSALLVTHDIEEALVLGDRIFVLADLPAVLSLTVRKVQEIESDAVKFQECFQYLRKCLGEKTPPDPPSALRREIEFERVA